MLADMLHVGDLYFGDLPSDNILDLHPELAGIRLRFGDGSPVIADMLILAGYLAVVASVASGDIDNKYFHYFASFL